MDFTIVCRNCGWEWRENQTESFDRHVCHKCGFDNKFIGFLGVENNFRNVMSSSNIGTQTTTTTTKYNCGVGKWSISPNLPSGLSINANTGVISGKTTKTYAGTYTITFTPIGGKPISTKWKLNILTP